MWTLHLILTGLYLQVSASSPSCTFANLVAYCASQYHFWVPSLPPNITHLYLDRNSISEINSTALTEYDQLRELDLGSQNVPLVIRNYAFLRQRKLLRLVLGANTGLQLEPRAFSGLFNLQILFLDFCLLDDSILSENYLQPLLALQTLDLSGNKIARVKPGPFFPQLRQFTQLNLKLNKIERLCEEDLVGFRGKHFTRLTLSSNSLSTMYGENYERERCGNPFRDVAFNVLDLSSNGFTFQKMTRFLETIQGTTIAHLIISDYMGKGFSHDNFPDPDENTFHGLMNSTVKILDLSKNVIFALKRSVFRPLKDVRTIDISRNRVNQIVRDAFDGLQGHLQMLNLSSNLLGQIHSYTFTNLAELIVLDLSYNHIGKLENEAFSGLPKLRALNLTGNSLRSLGSPASLPDLDFLLLRDNKLQSIYKITDLAMNSIHVDLNDNRLTNLEDVYFMVTHFKRLQNLLYSGNLIQWCTLNHNITIPQNNSLQVLFLQGSSLQMIWGQGKCLDMFDHLNSLLGLSISFNSLTTLPRGIFRGLSSIIEMDLSFNSLTFLQPNVLPVSLKQLDLSYNFLVTPDPVTFQSLLYLSLAGNRFQCDCHLQSFLHWLNVTPVILYGSFEAYRCEFPAALRNVHLLDYTTVVEPCDMDDEEAVQGLRLALLISSTLLILTATLSGVVYARLRGHIFIIYKKIVGRVLEGPNPTPPADDVQYDVFLCFSNSDYRWVEAALLNKLDNQFSEENIFHCCFEARDFLPGEDHLSNIRDAISGSRKTVCIISKEFLKDGWCLEAFTLAQCRMLEEMTNILILLVVGKVAHYQLLKYNAIRALIQKREYLVWPEDPQDLQWFYERLITQLLKDTKVKKVTEDNLPPAQPNVNINMRALPIREP